MVLVDSYERLPKLTHVLGFNCEPKGYKSLFDGNERERGLRRESCCKASFSSSVSLNTKALYKVL